MKVLVCEDDAKIRRGLIEILQNDGYDTLEAASGDEALQLFQTDKPDFICLDIMLPGINGYDLCRTIRRCDEQIPIMFITAKTEEIDRVIGLELGGDDYVVKPFGVNEIISRIRAITRRCYRSRQVEPEAEGEKFQIGGITVKPRELSAVRRGKCFELSLRDIKILQVLAREEGKVVSRDVIFNQCWGMNYLPNSRTLDQHISKLRKKIGDDPKNPCIIETVHGVGYRYRGRIGDAG